MVIACEKGNLEVVKLLLGEGFPYDIEDIYGNNCISIAALRGHINILEALHQSGVQFY
jgi:ankyrin repeat protein